ncbi:MAG: hypothetical protein ABI036_15140 [Fibrobacteria bacterium]
MKRSDRILFGIGNDRGWVLPGCVLALADGLLISARIFTPGRKSDVQS